MRTVVIIQARVGSTRLRGKIFKKLGSKTVLHHVIKRSLSINGVDLVCCAIPNTKENQIIKKKISSLKVKIIEGPEHDVLKRYYIAAEATKADIIIRVTSDCPLIDPYIISQALEKFKKENFDFASNNEIRTWPHGLDFEIFSMFWLSKANSEASTKFDREHVGPYMRNHPEIKKFNYQSPLKAIYRHRLTLDNLEDLKLLENIFLRSKNNLIETNFSYKYTLTLIDEIYRS